MGTAKRWAMINQDSGEKTWLTPPEIIEALGHFDLDPCAADNMPWRTADRMVTKAENGLLVDWDGKRVWCNPPYGRESVPFLDKMARHADGGGVRPYFRAHGCAVLARLHIPVRGRGVFLPWPLALPPRRRIAWRRLPHAKRAHFVFAARHGNACKGGVQGQFGSPAQVKTAQP